MALTLINYSSLAAPLKTAYFFTHIKRIKMNNETKTKFVAILAAAQAKATPTATEAKKEAAAHPIMKIKDK